MWCLHTKPHNLFILPHYCVASQSSSSDVTTRDKKISTTSFGSGYAGGDYLSTTLERGRSSGTTGRDYLSTTLDRKKDYFEAAGMCFETNFGKVIFYFVF